jgi:serine/threonine protein kinase
MSENYHNALAGGSRLESYEIQDILGVGGFGITYKGYDHDLHCHVAIKEYLPDGLALRADDGTSVTPRSDGDEPYYKQGLKRFLEEARILAKFKERSIVRVTRFLEANGTGYLLMDYEEGESLAQLLKRTGILGEEEVYAILIPILHGLKVVHAAGIMHRDIKPANIFLRKDGSPVLLDFGAARQALAGQTVALTQIVTPGYGPFEQYGSTERQGPWTDLYSLGATLYHCVAGKAPPKAPDRIAALHEGSADPMKSAVDIGAGRYNKSLLELIDGFLSPHSKDRPQSAEIGLARLQQTPRTTPTQTAVLGDDIEKTIVLAAQTSKPRLDVAAPSVHEQTEEFIQCYKLAEKGNINAQFELGMMYAYGRGNNKNEIAAQEWLEKSASGGHLLAQCRLGIMLARGAGVTKDEVGATKWLKLAAEKGDSSAQFNLGMLCAHGIGVQQNTRQALQWYTKAAQQGHVGAISNLEILAARKMHQRWRTILFSLAVLITAFLIWRYFYAG